MRQRDCLRILLGLLVLLAASACKGEKPETPYSDPPADWRESDLAGTWEARYGRGGADIDRLTLKEDGTFRQVYEEAHAPKGYRFETAWNEWRVERFTDGRVLLHLVGARYYKAGIAIAELDGMAPPYIDKYLIQRGDKPGPESFWDPVHRVGVKMPGELILLVQRTCDGEIVLLHAVLSPDSAWTFGGRAEGFRRVKEA